MDGIIASISQFQTLPLMMFLLGLLFVIEPHALMTNLGALGYIGQDGTHRRRVAINGLFYILGRSVMYLLLGGLLIVLLRRGDRIEGITTFLSLYGRWFLIGFLLLIGLLFILPLHLPHFHVNLQHVNQKKVQRPLGSFLLGGVLALAFCPTDALLFFGMIIPMVSSDPMGLANLLIFVVSAALPLLLLVWLMVRSLKRLPEIKSYIMRYSKRIRLVIGGLFILAALFAFLHHAPEIEPADLPQIERSIAH